MATRLWKVAILVGMIIGPVPSTRADDTFGPGRGDSPSAAPANQTIASRQDGASYPSPVGVGSGKSASPANYTQPPQGQWSPAPASDQAASVARTSQLAPSPAGNGIVRLPPTGLVNPGGTPVVSPQSGPGPHVDGTYREDGQFVTININGKEMTLVKPTSMQDPSVQAPRQTGEGSVRGRLMQNGRPLANCRVVIMPLQGEGKAYHFDPNREPLTTTTDNEGIYFIEHVPLGQYKLTWLPNGTNQWIRRIAIKPDVIVRNSGEAVSVNTVGAARQTIN
jgi:hypothetical protein